MDQNSNPLQYTNNTHDNIVAINCGYGNIKWAYNNKTYITPSKVSEYVDESLSQTIVVDNIRYCVGTGLPNLSLDKTTTLHQKVLISYVLSKIPLQNKRIITAMPVNSYINKDARKQYKDYILSFNGVTDAIIYMEGASLAIYDSDYFNNKLVLLMDFGFNTINFMLFDSGVLVKGTAISKLLGRTILENKIRKALEQESLVNVPEYQIKYLMQSPTSQRIIKEHIDEIKLVLHEMKYPTNVNIRFTGGGVIGIEQYLKKEFNCYIGNNSIFENVIGLYYIGKEVFK